MHMFNTMLTETLVEHRHAELRRVAGHTDSARRRAARERQRQRADKHDTHPLRSAEWSTSDRIESRYLHLLGCFDPEQVQTVGQHPGGHVAQRQATRPGAGIRALSTGQCS